MRNGCLHAIVILVASLLGLLMWMDRAQADPASSVASPATQTATESTSLQTAVASQVTDVTPATSQPADASASTSSTSPADSVAQVAKAYEELGLPQMPVVEDRNARMYAMTHPQEVSKGLISGQVISEDGQPIEGNIGVSVYANSGSEYGNGKQGAFSISASVGTAWVVAYAEGWAFAVAGPFEISADKPVDDVTIVLTRGISMQVQVRDPQGKPVAGAMVASLTNVGNSSTKTEGKLTDAEGNITLEHLNPGNQQIQIEARDYYKWDRRMEVADGAVLKASLAPIEPITGHVIAKTDGKPMANAKVYLVDRQSDPRDRYFHSGFEPVATTDSKGYFLFRREFYENAYLMILSEDHRALAVGPIPAGKEITCKMPEPLYVKGTFKGDLNKLPTWMNGTYRFQVELDNPMPAAYEDHNRSVLAYIAHPVDGKVEFELPMFFPGKVGIRIDNKIIRELDVTQSVTDLVIDLDHPEAPADKQAPQGSADPLPADVMVQLAIPGMLDQSLAMAMAGQVNAGQSDTRELVLKFIPPPGSTQVLGAVNFRGVVVEDPYNGKFVQVKDNQVSIMVRTPSSPQFSLKNLLGAIGKSDHIAVPRGDGPIIKEIRLSPAGAIRCTVVNEAGDPVDGREVHVTMPQGFLDDYYENSGDLKALEGKMDDQRVYLASPVPMGKPVRLYVKGAMSEPITLTADHPVVDAKIVIPNGQSVKVHVINPDGTPATGKKTMVWWSPNNGTRFGSSDQRTDGAGDLYLDGVNLGPNAGATIVMVNGGYGLQDSSIELATGKTDLTIQLQAGLRAHGRVIDAETHRPAIGIQVMASQVGGQGSSHLDMGKATTDEEGRFEFTQLAKGTYRIILNGMLQPKPKPKFLGLDGGREELPTFQAGQEKDLLVEIVPFNNQPRTYLMGDAPATQPAR